MKTHIHFPMQSFRRILSGLVCFSLVSGLVGGIGASHVSAAPPKAQRPRVQKAPSESAGSQSSDPVLQKARALAAAGRYQDASRVLFQLSRNPKYAAESPQIKYILGLMLYEMKLNQASAFIFYDVVRQESGSGHQDKYLRQSLQKLALAADTLGSDVLTRYAIKQVKEEDFPAENRDMLAFHMGEIKMQDKDYINAARDFSRIRQGSVFYTRARYNIGLSLTQGNQLDKAKAVFDELAEASKAGGITDHNRVNALLGKARVLYQQQKFEEAIDAYRDIPRDTEQWHESLFEQSWAMLRDGRFRSALSNFHTLHSPYYEDYYQPESIFLRAIVYLYICRYEEMEKVLNLFEQVYQPTQGRMRDMLATVNDPGVYLRELQKVRAAPNAKKSVSQIPYTVGREILKEGDVKKSLFYIRSLEGERKRIEAMPPVWKSAGIGIYAKTAVEKRLEAAQIFAGKQIRRHLAIAFNDLKDLFEQEGFLRFEMLSSKKESVRKEIAGKDLERTRVDQGNARSYYIQNGYEYWPFKGEYWLDELGNYHYVGVKACE